MDSSFQQSYEIKSLIGQGGMSKVYLAEHKRLHTRWAVKEVYKQQNAKFDFLAESNILKRLQHPMLPRIVDIFEDTERILIVEDFVEGITLAELLLEQKKVEEELGLRWFQELCTVLRYLHHQEPHPVIYRDMKPANVMLQPDGSLKLIDFGIAREYKQDSNADTTYIGTKGYAAPEQFGKAQTDARTDIYALGVTMYHLLTGKSPYEPPYQFVSARQLNARLSHGMEYILNKCTQSEPENRYQTADELLEDLNHIYKFDRAFQKVQTVKRVRVGILAVMLAASLALMAVGRGQMAVEKETAYQQFLATAGTLYHSDSTAALAALDAAKALFPDRVESERQHTYALYLSGSYEDCVDYGEKTLERFAGDGDTLRTTASAYYELGEYKQAAAYFQQAGQSPDMSVDNLRDYAVCLGRLGHIEAAAVQLDALVGKGATPDVTDYVRGEVFYAQGAYVDAEQAFLSALKITESDHLLRRCYLSLAETYRDGTAVIADAVSREISLLDTALRLPQLQGNAVLYEMLGAACYNRATQDKKNSADFMRSAACFEKVIALGVAKEYLYT
ncbi:MAG: protein kinase, partial [Oscillospiraceae bacterium]